MVIWLKSVEIRNTEPSNTKYRPRDTSLIPVVEKGKNVCSDSLFNSFVFLPMLKRTTSLFLIFILFTNKCLTRIWMAACMLPSPSFADTATLKSGLDYQAIPSPWLDQINFSQISLVKITFQWTHVSQLFLPTLSILLIFQNWLCQNHFHLWHFPNKIVTNYSILGLQHRVNCEGVPPTCQLCFPRARQELMKLQQQVQLDWMYCLLQ